MVLKASSYTLISHIQLEDSDDAKITFDSKPDLLPFTKECLLCPPIGSLPGTSLLKLYQPCCNIPWLRVTVLEFYHSPFSARSLNNSGFAVLAGTRRLARHDSVPLGMTYCLISYANGRLNNLIHQFAAVCSGTTKTQLISNLSISCMTSGMTLTGGKIQA